MMPREQDLHGKPVAGCNLDDEGRVGVVAVRRRRRLARNDRVVAGKMAAHRRLPRTFLTVNVIRPEAATVCVSYLTKGSRFAAGAVLKGWVKQRDSHDKVAG